MRDKPIDRAHCELTAKSILDFRKRRETLLPASLLREPAWDILLSVYANSVGGYVCSIDELTTVTQMSESTTARLLDILIDGGFIEPLTQTQLPTFRLSGKTVAAIDHYMADVIEHCKKKDYWPKNLVKKSRWIEIC